MSSFSRRLLGLLGLLAFAAPAAGQLPGMDRFDPPAAAGSGDSRDTVSVAMKTATDRVAPGGDLPVVIVFDVSDRWHIWPDARPVPPGMGEFEFAIRTAVSVTAPTDGRVIVHEKFAAWPDLHQVTADLGDGPTSYGVFEGRAVLAIPVTVAADAAPGPVTLRATVTFQSCDDRVCLQPVFDLPLEATIEIVAPGTAMTSSDPDPDFAGFPADVFGRIRGGEKAAENIDFGLFGLQFTINAASTTGLVLLLIVAALGGFLLNLTPCVLPVIPIKIMGLSMSAGNRARTLLLGVSMSLGIVAFWMGLGVAIAAVAGFTATNQLFQYPAFTLSVGVIIAVMAVGMCGVFSLRLPRFVYSVSPSHDSLHGSFGFGVMTAILSTPCTAPFMGAAAAWAATQATGTILSVFASIGGGMAMPYLVLAAFPNLVDRMPRTGPASELIKQVMGLFMLAAAAYFVGVGLSGLFAAPPAPPSRVYWWAVAGLVAAAGGWMAWRTIRITRAPARRLVFGGLGVLFVVVAVAGAVRLTDKGPIDWVYYTPEQFAAAQADGNVVVMEFTAEWCLNCHALEQSVLRHPRIVEQLNADGVVPIKVDLTGDAELGNAMLGKVNRLTIPLLVVFRPDGTETFKADFYTVEQVLTAIGEAAGTQVARGGS